MSFSVAESIRRNYLQLGADGKVMPIQHPEIREIAVLARICPDCRSVLSPQFCCLKCLNDHESVIIDLPDYS